MRNPVFFDIILKGVILVSKYKVGAYVRLSKDDILVKIGKNK